MQQPANSHEYQLSTPRRWWHLLSILLLFMLNSGVVYAECVGVIGGAAVTACQDELDANPRNLKVRLSLATALDRLGRKDEALKVLDQGLVLFRGDATSRSILEEKRWVIQQAQVPSTSSDAAARVKIIKCTTLKGAAALKACDEGLRSLPDNPDLLAGKGDALLELSPAKVADAITAYKKALAISPSSTEIKQKLAHADAVRQKSVSVCMNDADKMALAACDRALLKGSPDEAAIHARRGDLLVANNQDKEALEEYRVALQLEPGNSAAKQAINRLTEVKKVPVSPQPSPSPPSSLPPKNPAPPKLARVFSNAPLSTGITY